jgi:hypothetical protein
MMKLKQTSLVTEDVDRLARFYETVTGSERRSRGPCMSNWKHPVQDWRSPAPECVRPTERT